MWATVNFATWYSDYADSFTKASQYIDGLTGDMVKYFFTPRKPPTEAIMPIAIVSGIAAMITSIAPWGKYAALGAAVSGALSLVQGLLTQDELNRPK